MLQNSIHIQSKKQGEKGRKYLTADLCEMHDIYENFSFKILYNTI